MKGSTPPRRLAILAAGVGSPSTKESSPRRHLVILAGEGGGQKTKGSARGRRLTVLAGGGSGPLVGKSAPGRRLAILAAGVGGPSTKGTGRRGRRPHDEGLGDVIISWRWMLWRATASVERHRVT